MGGGASMSAHLRGDRSRKSSSWRRPADPGFFRMRPINTVDSRPRSEAVDLHTEAISWPIGDHVINHARVRNANRSQEQPAILKINGTWITTRHHEVEWKPQPASVFGLPVGCHDNSYIHSTSKNLSYIAINQYIIGSSIMETSYFQFCLVAQTLAGLRVERNDLRASRSGTQENEFARIRRVCSGRFMERQVLTMVGGRFLSSRN